MDDNDELLELLLARLQIGRERYGLGIRVGDDTRQWGTENDAWAEMGLEEALDLCLYLTAAMVRLKKSDMFCHSCVAPPSEKKGLIRRFFSWLY